MPNITVNLPEDYYAELSEVAKRLNETPENCILLALNHLFQTDTLDNLIEGMERVSDGQALVDFPELKEELGLAIQFHPRAMEELEALAEEEQIDVLEQLVERMSADEEELLDSIDLVIKELPEGELILSSFNFGDILYLNGENIIIYHLAVTEDFASDAFAEEDDEEENEDEDFEEDEMMFDELQDEGEEEYKMSSN